jgi:hypothetical protein
MITVDEGRLQAADEGTGWDHEAEWHPGGGSRMAGARPDWGRFSVP